MEVFYDDNYKWLRQIENQRFFLPNMERMFSLSCLQSMSLRQLMDWELTRVQKGVSIKQISKHTAFPAGHERDVVGMQSGLLKAEYQ